VYANIPPGNYTFKAIAKNSFGIESKEAISFSFTVSPPYWKTWWFRTCVGLVILCAIVFYIKWRERSLKKRQRQLERTVEERTIEVVKQKEIAEEQKHIIEEKHKEITDSINYAERIQRSFLATKELLNENLNDYFVFFQPKDVVSGDFYWACPSPEGFIYITADCTGHGVPGAFMSLLNISKLSQTINENKIYRCDQILNTIRSEIIKVLNPHGSSEESKDGMDAVVCKLDLKNMKLEYAAANNSFYIIRNNNLHVCKADKMPVGKGFNDSLPFSYNEIALHKGDIIYTFTDGFADQFGGPLGKKYKYKAFEEFLLSIHQNNLATQKELLLQSFNTWKGDLEQVDDVCVLAVKV
jgi:serine phosphatase RsbU (regulator of sigma subunit)